MSKPQQYLLKLCIGFCGILLLLALWVFRDYRRIQKIQPVAAKGGVHDLLKRKISAQHILNLFHSGASPNEIHWEDFYPTLIYMHERFDTADFNLPDLARLVHRHGDSIPDRVMQDIRKTLTGYKYWLTYNGKDGVCYWSENHQLLFSTGEYLLGHFWENEIFATTGKSGQFHKANGKERILTWLEQRWRFGIIEWNSNVYYGFTINPLLALVELAPDEEIRIKASMILDLIFYDIASQSYKGTFVTTSGRAYARNRISGSFVGIRGTIDGIWPEFAPLDKEGNSIQRGHDLLAGVPAYEVPPVIRKIGLDPSTAIMKCSTGLNLKELKALDLIGVRDEQIMMQWGMESFTNPEVISNTLNYMGKFQLFSNEFLHELKMLDYGALYSANLLPVLSRALNPQANGTAIQRANIYTYRTGHFAMSTAQAYHPGTFGDQHHLFSLTLSPQVSLFHAHPATPLGGGALGGSPGYWTGYGRIPHQVQENQINMAIYKIEATKGFGEARVFEFTHYYLPERFLDDVVLDVRYAFARLDSTYVAIIGKNPLHYTDPAFIEKVGDVDPRVKDNFIDLWGGLVNQKDGQSNRYDLIQEGVNHYWITEIGLVEDYDSFDSFKTNIKSRNIQYQDDVLSYEGSAEQTYQLMYQGDFSIEGEKIPLEYPRIDAPYGHVQRDPTEIRFEFDEKYLRLQFESVRREFNN